MRNRNTNVILRGVSILFLTAALVLGIVSLIRYSRQRNNYPAGMSIAGVPAGGLTPAEASQRLLEVYTSPIEVLYNDAVVHIDPALDLTDKVLAVLDEVIGDRYDPHLGRSQPQRQRRLFLL